MTTDLAAFLAAHPLAVDARIVEWRSEGTETLGCVLEAFPWWRPNAERRVAVERLTLRFAGVRASNVALGWREADVEPDALAVLTDDPRLWPFGPHATIYGNSPLPDPGRFFLELWDVMHVELDAGGAFPFPFEGVPFHAWAERVSRNQTYHLLDGPAPLMQACRPLLDAQGVEYVLLTAARPVVDGLCVVWVGTSWVVCADVWVDNAPGSPTAA